MSADNIPSATEMFRVMMTDDPRYMDVGVVETSDGYLYTVVRPHRDVWRPSRGTVFVLNPAHRDEVNALLGEWNQ